jgi:enoyl-CoA hydratase/carnithine racemase
VAGDAEVALRSMVAQVFSNSALALRKAKRAVRLGFADEFDQRLKQVERLYLDELLTAADAEEGIRAFLEKRLPCWRDE